MADLQHSAFYNCAKFYLGIHKTIPQDFEVTDAVLDEFNQFLASAKIPFSDQGHVSRSEKGMRSFRQELFKLVVGIRVEVLGMVCELP